EIAATVESTTLAGEERLLHRKLALVSDRFTRSDQDVERDRLMTIGLDLDPRATGVDSELLEHAVEFIDDAHEVAIHVDLRFARLDLQPERSGRALAVRARSGPVAAPVVSATAPANRAGVVAAVVVGV